MIDPVEARRASERPPVSVVVPFAGDSRAAERMLAASRRLELWPADELIVADNTGARTVAPLAPPSVAIVEAGEARSSYHARNAGAAIARGEWLLFMDADCAPARDLIDAYFEPPPATGCAALAGQIDGDPGQDSFLARYTQSRKFFRQDAGFLSEAGTAATGNLLVRRSAFAEIGGFAEGIRSGGDVDLCRRLRLAGWSIEARVGAVVHHRHRDSLPSLLGAIARYAAGSRWLNERYPGDPGAWPLLPGLAGVARDVPLRLATGRFQEAGFRAVDGLGLAAHVIGYRTSNDAPALRR